MTTPRIQSNNTATTTDSLDASYPQTPECVGEPAMQTPSGREEELAGVYDASERLHRSAEQEKNFFQDVHDEIVDVVGAATACLESPDERVRQLERNETAVGKLAFDLEVTAGAGGSAAAGLEYKVTRDQKDTYTGVFSGDLELGAKLGTSVDDKGISGGIAGAHAVRIEVEGEGPAAAEEFAGLVTSSPTAIPTTIADSNAVHVKSIAWDTDVSAVGSVGAGLKTTVTLIKGVERDPSGELRPMGGFAVSSSGKIGTPTLDPNNDEIATDLTNSAPMMKMLPREVSEEIVRFNGGVVGIDAAVNARVEVRQTGALESGLTTMKGEFTASYNNRTFEAKMSATLDSSTSNLAEIEDALKEGNIAKAQEIADQIGVEFDVEMNVVEFDGCSATGPVEYRNGIERPDELWKFNRRLN